MWLVVGGWWLGKASMFCKKNVIARNKMTKQSIQKGRGKPWSFAALNPQLFGSVMPVCKQPVATLALDSCPLASTAFGVFRYPFTPRGLP